MIVFLLLDMVVFFLDMVVFFYIIVGGRGGEVCFIRFNTVFILYYSICVACLLSDIIVFLLLDTVVFCWI